MYWKVLEMIVYVFLVFNGDDVFDFFGKVDEYGVCEVEVLFGGVVLFV